MSIAAKIAAIIAKAEGSTHPEEAETFMAKAQRMMLDYGISLQDLGKLGDDPIAVDMNATYNFQSDAWQANLADAAARYFGCKVIHCKEGCRDNHAVAGRASARVTYTLMFGYFTRSVSKLASKAVADGTYRTKSQARTAIGKALTVRLIWERQNSEDIKAAEGEGLNALVPLDLIKLAVEEAFPSATSKKGRPISYTGKAMDLANGISLNMKPTAGIGKQLLLK